MSEELGKYTNVRMHYTTDKGRLANELVKFICCLTILTGHEEKVVAFSVVRQYY